MNTEEYLLLLSSKNYRNNCTHDLAETVLNTAASTGAMIESFDFVFDIDNASGVQLDIIGTIIGVSRLLEYTPATGDRLMDDDEYRVMLKLSIAKNGWDGTLGSVRGIYAEAFGGTLNIVYTDTQDMHVDIDIYGDVKTRTVEIMRNTGAFLLPAGVSKSIATIADEVSVETNIAVGICSFVLGEYATAIGEE